MKKKITITITIIIICLFPFNIFSQNITNLATDTIINGIYKTIILKDVYSKPYLKRYYSNNKLDSIHYIIENSSLFVYDNVAMNTIARPEKYNDLERFISENLIWPKNFDGTGIVMVCFIVDNCGNITFPRIVKSIDVCQECNEQAIAITKRFPKWIPAMINNKQIPVIVYYPIKFKVR